ncbi:MAG: hypothetical protein V4486_02680 [Patescibacteria group bacterium]
MDSSPEPRHVISACIYCGDAPIPHKLFYVVSLFGTRLDSHILKVTKHAPGFLKDFVDFLLNSFFNILIFFKLARLSDDIDKVKTFRSRVIWEEARKRGIDMRQVIMFGRPVDQYHVKISGKNEYFNSLPIPQRLLRIKKNWDDKFVLKEELARAGVPVPAYVQFPVFLPHNIDKIFSKLNKPLIVKPRVGSRGRHTTTNIHTKEELGAGIDVAKQICAFLVVEEHLVGDVCRATFVNGELMGFYRGGAPFVIGDGKQTVRQLIMEKDINRPARVEKVSMGKEIEDHVKRSGYGLDEILPFHIRLPLTYRTGRFYGGETKEMLDELHPSYIPILKRAAAVVDLPVIGFDVIVPDPRADADTQKWGIIECNTLPFIDLHYYALEGKPKNIAGAIWDLWDVN